MKKIILTTIILITLCACNGIIKTKIWTQEELRVAATAQGPGITGVFGYYQRPVIEVSQMTALVDKDNKFVSRNCNPVPVKKIVNITDYEHPVQIWYEPGLLEANEFKVALADSVFTGINSVSTPDQGKTLLNLSQAATNFAKIPGGAAAPSFGPSAERPSCNGEPFFIEYQPLQHIPG